MRIELDPRAEAEARPALLWYFGRSPAAGIGFRDDLERSLRQIADAPKRWPEVTATLRRCLFRRFPYAVIYWIATDEVVRVVAVAHRSNRIACVKDGGLVPSQWGDNDKRFVFQNGKPVPQAADVEPEHGPLIRAVKNGWGKFVARDVKREGA